MIAFVSCSKESFYKPEDADAFVGTYSYTSMESVVWGYDSGTFKENGILTITKISSNKVKVVGKFIYDEADVVTSTIYLPDDYFSDNAGYYKRTFSHGKLTGNQLTFIMYRDGELASNGRLYPYHSTTSFIATKIID